MFSHFIEVQSDKDFFKYRIYLKGTLSALKQEYKNKECLTYLATPNLLNKKLGQSASTCSAYKKLILLVC